MTTELENNAKPKGCLRVLLEINSFVLLMLSLLFVLMYTAYSPDRKIHPDYAYAMSEHAEFLNYTLTTTEGRLQPDWLDCVGMQGICLDGKDLYLEYHSEEYYHFRLGGLERVKLEKLPAHIKLIDPKIFWKSLEGSSSN